MKIERQCSVCKGSGGIWEKVRSPRNTSAPVQSSRVPCPVTTCVGGKISEELVKLERLRNEWFGRPVSEMPPEVRLLLDT